MASKPQQPVRRAKLAITFPASITGAAQTGFTSPTYTTVADIAPNQTGKQVAITAVGGTQAGVTTHSVSSPFTLNFTRPLSLRRVGQPGANGFISNVPQNNYKLITRKGVVPAAGQPARPMVITVLFEVPAGAETYDAANVRACISAAIGAAYALAPGAGDTFVTGIA